MTNIDGSLPRSPIAWWREGAIVLVAFAFCLAGGVFRVNDTFSAPPVAAYAIAALSSAVLLARHQVPLAALAGTTLSGMLAAPLGLLLTPLTVIPVVIAAYALSVRVEWRVATSALLVSVAALVASAALFATLSWQDASRLGAVAVFPLVAAVLGHSAQNRRAYLAAVEERAQRAEESRDSEARSRVAEERVRIARELHDLVAHQITLASAQATVAEHLFGTRPEQTRKSLQQLVETTSNALDDLRATVGLLRQSGDAPAPVEPTPGLSRLPTLLESFRRAGLEVSVTHDGTLRALPPGVDLTAYRIIQEALTNVAKHAGTGDARVCLTWNRDRLIITVADDGKATSTSAVSGRPPGFGLIGMRERVTAVGGQLSAGKRDEGGFLVSTHLPLHPIRNSPSQPDAVSTTDSRPSGGESKDPR